MEQQAFRFSGEAAENYDQYLGPFLFEPYGLELASRLDPLKANSVLEVACGTGRVTRHIRNQIRPGARFVATDISTDMLEVAKRNLGENSIEFQMADAQALPFPENNFDYVLCQFGLMFLPDKQKGIQEAYRVLKPGGKLFFSTWERTAKVPFLKILFNDILLPFFNEDESSRYVLPFSLHQPGQLIAWMKKSGFCETTVERIELQGHATSASQLVTGFLIKHPLGKEVVLKDPDALPRLAERFENEIILKFGNNPVKCDLAAFVASATKPRL